MKPRSLEEARAADDEADGTAVPEVVEYVEPHGLCLMCDEPGTGGRDALGNEYCAAHHAGRLVHGGPPKSRRSRGSTKPPGAVVEAVPKLGDAECRARLDGVLDRLALKIGRGHYQQRMPYRDHDDEIRDPDPDYGL